MQSFVRPERVFGKAVLIFVLINILFAWLDPPLQHLLLFRDYRRFPKLWEPTQHSNGETLNGFRQTLIGDLELLFHSHIISAVPKEEDEYRVFLIGDSSIWGVSLYSDETMEALLNRMGLSTCSGKRISVYNLGYEFSSVSKDAIILSEALEYNPDLVVWFFSLVGFMPRRQDIGFVEENQEKLQSVSKRQDDALESKSLARRWNGFWEKTLIGRRRQLRFVIKLNLSRLMLEMLDVSDPGVSYPRPRASGNYSSEDPNLWGISPLAPVKAYANLNLLDSLDQTLNHSDVVVVYINEPIGRGRETGVRYNRYYPRWAYDQYRLAIGQVAAEKGWSYIDLWDYLSPTEFSDTPFHHTPEGERRLAQKLAEIIVAQACKSP